MKVFLDATKEAPKGFVHATSVGQAINLFRNNDVTHLSLAAVVGNGELGEDLAKFLLELAKDGLIPSLTHTVHSGRSVALSRAMSGVDFYTGRTNIDGAVYA